MRTVSAAMATYLANEELTLAQCVKVTRRDGEVFGFTTCNADLVVDGVTYAASSSVSSSAQKSAVGTGVDNMEALGIISSESVTEEDLLAGRFDGAAIEVFLVNWADLTMGTISLFSGWIGNVEVTDGQFTAEIRSKSQKLSQKIGQLTSPLCRVARFGDARCGLVAESYQFSRTVTAVTDNRHMTFGADEHETGYFDCGLVTFTSGANDGISKEIKLHLLDDGEAVIELQEEFPFDVEFGDLAILEVGCDRRHETCRDKFANVINFRGEPHVPGTSAVMGRGRR